MAVTSRLIMDKVLDLLIDTVFVVDAEGCIAFISTSCETLLGYTQEELLGRRMIEFVLPEDRELTLKAASAVMEGRSHLHFKNRYVRKDGQIVDIMWSARWSESEGLRFAVARDITALKHAERKQSAVYEISEAAHATENLESLYQQIHRIITGLLPTDLFFTAQYDKLNDTLSFPYFSGGLAKQPEPQSLESGSRLARVIHSGKSLLLSSADLDTGPTLELAGIEGYQQWLGVPLISQKGVIGALVMARRSGDIVFTERDRDLLCFVSTQVATTIERKQAELQLHHIASHDPLTDLPNRILFQDRLEVALKRAYRDHEKVALLYLDLDGFKSINDSFGHQVGDLFLCEMGQRLSKCVRDSDTVARMSGDEFAVILTNIQGQESIEATVHKIQATIELPFELPECTFRISASIGTALYPDQGENPEQLIRHADQSMYHAKPH